jgi:hypothetical protein
LVILASIAAFLGARSALTKLVASDFVSTPEPAPKVVMTLVLLVLTAVVAMAWKDQI